MQLIIVTGASKGLGAALVEHLLSPERRIVGIARTANDALAAAARGRNAWLDWYLQDLADPAATDALAASIAADLPRDADFYALVNNAALADPIGPVAGLDAARVAASINVNVTAAMLFTARFLAATAPLDAERRVLNISSGLARRPMDGTAAYCTGKAALDMFTRCINVEPHDAARAVRKAKAVSLAPGVIDTGMQVVLRGQDASVFPEGQHFRKMKDEGRLSSPDEVALRIAEYLQRDDFGTKELDDIRSY